LTATLNRHENLLFELNGTGRYFSEEV